MRILRYWKTVPLKTAPFHATYPLVKVTKIKEEEVLNFEHILAAVKATEFLDFEVVDVAKKKLDGRGGQSDAG